MEVTTVKRDVLKSPAFIFIVIFELISADITVYEVFTNLQAGLNNSTYLAAVVVIAIIVFIFLLIVGYEAFEFLLNLEKASKS